MTAEEGGQGLEKGGEEGAHDGQAGADDADAGLDEGEGYGGGFEPWVGSGLEVCWLKKWEGRGREGGLTGEVYVGDFELGGHVCAEDA